MFTRATLVYIVSTMCSACFTSRSVADETKSQTAGGRTIVTAGWVPNPPLFPGGANTLDPASIAHDCWKGYLTLQPDPWGMTTGLKPTLRFHFDNRALPWPSLKHHVVDGFDNNGRNVGAHALLHEMFGAEKNFDPAEEGELAYLLSCSDPESGFAYSPDVLPRHCPLAEGEMARNLMLLYKETGDQSLLDWSHKMLKTLRTYAVIRERPGIGEVASYTQGGTGGQGGFDVGTPALAQAVDPTLDGWQYLYVGWNMRAFSEYYDLSGDKDALRLAVALKNRLCNSESDDGDDGSLRSDGSFGGKHKDGSWHMHGHTHCLPGLVSLGVQLIRAGRNDEGTTTIVQAVKTMDWLYDPARNPDAGSMTGWLGEFLNIAAGWTRKADCEGCTMGDVTQTACELGAASHLDPRLADLERFYDRAEQMYSGEIVEQMFQVTPRYLAVLRDCLTKRIGEEMPNAPVEMKAKEVELRYSRAIETSNRMIGQQLGLCGFPDWVNHLPSDLDPKLPGIHMQGCCADATIRASHAIWSQTVSGNETEARVNLAFNRDSELVRVVSSLPYRGELDVFVKKAHRVLIRVPLWADKSEVYAFVARRGVPVRWDGNYVAFDGTNPGEQLTVTYPLRITTVTEPIQGTVYTERWRGNTVVDIAPGGKWIPMFHRPELDTNNVPN